MRKQIKKSTEINCRVCGDLIKQSEGKGRVKEYCSKNCSNCMKYFNAFQDALSNVDFKSSDKLKIFKGDLFSLRNSLSNKIKG